MTHNTETTEEITVTDLNEQERAVPIVQQLAILSLILLLIFGSGYVPNVLESLEDEDVPMAAEVPMLAVEDVPEDTDPFQAIVLQAEAAFVWDVAEQRALYTLNPNEQLPLASVSKLMTALVAHELLADDTKVPVTVSAILQDGNSGLADGDQFTLRDILTLTLLSSSNDGAYAVASAVGSEITGDGDASTFVEAMNIRASELGLTQTYFRNPTGLDISAEEGGAYGSARDVTFLMEYILTHYPEILAATTQTTGEVYSDAGLLYDVANTNPTVERINGLIGSKTGYTDLAGGNLAIAFDAAYNRPVIVVVLGSTRNARFDDVLSLADAARKSIN